MTDPLALSSHIDPDTGYYVEHRRMHDDPADTFWLASVTPTSMTFAGHTAERAVELLAAFQVRMAA